MVTTADLIRRMGGTVPNTDNDTGIAFGAVMQHDLADWVLDEIETHGEYVGMCQEGVCEDWGDACETCSGPEGEDFLYTYDQLVDGPDGKPGQLKIETFYLGGAIHLSVQASPWVAQVPECSPCVPCAGDLEPPCERPKMESRNAARALFDAVRSELARACPLISPSSWRQIGTRPAPIMVLAYDLPPDWWRED